MGKADGGHGPIGGQSTSAPTPARVLAGRRGSACPNRGEHQRTAGQKPGGGGRALPGSAPLPPLPPHTRNGLGRTSPRTPRALTRPQTKGEAAAGTDRARPQRSSLRAVPLPRHAPHRRPPPAAAPQREAPPRPGPVSPFPVPPPARRTDGPVFIFAAVPAEPTIWAELGPD